jgi:hypothetical protein
MIDVLAYALIDVLEYANARLSVYSLRQETSG